MARPNDRQATPLFFQLAFHLSGDDGDGGKFTADISGICRGIRPPLAPFPPLVKTRRDKRFDLVGGGA